MTSITTPSSKVLVKPLSSVRRDQITIWLILAALAIRLFLIFPGPFESKVDAVSNRADLRNYYWPAQEVLKGNNPYTLWASGESGDFRADMAPLELLVYVGTAAVWNDPRAIQVLFALFDALNILLLGLLLVNSPLRRPFQLFYALGPLTLYNLVLVPEDKTIVLALTFSLLILVRLPRGSVWRAGPFRFDAAMLVMVIAGLIAAFKWLSVFYIVPLLWFTSSDVRSMIKHAVLFAGVLVLAHIPWVPTWWYVYAFRSARTATPLHISPAVLLNALGGYDKTLLFVVLLFSLGCIYLLFWAKRIDIFETITLATTMGILWTPDMDPVHLSLVVIGLLLVVNWASPLRTAIVWLLSLMVAGIYAISTHSGFSRLGPPDLRSLTGDYGSLQMVVLSYLLFLAVLLFYLSDKVRGHAVGEAVVSPVTNGRESHLEMGPATP